MFNFHRKPFNFDTLDKRETEDATPLKNGKDSDDEVEFSFCGRGDVCYSLGT
jgi:hypothetical protein